MGHVSKASVRVDGINEPVPDGGVGVARASGPIYCIFNAEIRHATSGEAEVEGAVEQGMGSSGEHLSENDVLYLLKNWSGDGAVKAGVIGLYIFIIPLELIV